MRYHRDETHSLNRGELALADHLQNGAALYLWNAQRGWVPAGPHSVECAQQLVELSRGTDGYATSAGASLLRYATEK